MESLDFNLAHRYGIFGNLQITGLKQHIDELYKSVQIDSDAVINQ
jgi:hypothetical protein